MKTKVAPPWFEIHFEPYPGSRKKESTTIRKTRRGEYRFATKLNYFDGFQGRVTIKEPDGSVYYFDSK